MDTVYMERGDPMKTEQRLIDFDAFGLFLMGKMGFNPANAEMVMQWMDEFIKKNTVDAVEVVRCKDCRYYELHKCHNGVNGWFSHRMSDDFCSYGERRTDG